MQVVIVAAGCSRRAGRDKALLPWAGRPLVRHIVEQFRGNRSAWVGVVGNPRNQERIAAVLPANAELVVNAEPNADMLSSVRCGMARCSNAGGPLCVHPVDVFAVTRDLVALLHDAWQRQPEQIHVPLVAGRRAHPVLIPAVMMPLINAISPGYGLNRLLRDNPGRVVEQRWDDERLLADLDTPEDYERYCPK